jgi:hypothetical protein
MRRSFVLLLLLSPAAGLASDRVTLTQEEFKMYRQYQKAMSDPRVEKIKPDKRLAAIAKDAGFKLKELERAISAGEQAGDVKAQCEAAIRQDLGQGALGGRLGTVEVDTDEPHAVAYVQWLNENPTRLEEEASWGAAVVAKACPLLSTIQLWAQDKQRPTQRVFQALISRAAAARINPDRAKDFAHTRYIRLFEQVKNAANGDELASGEAKPTHAPVQ